MRAELCKISINDLWNINKFFTKGQKSTPIKGQGQLINVNPFGSWKCMASRPAYKP